MKKTKLILVLMAFALLFVACDKRPEGSVAKVGDEYITKEEFDKEFNIYKNMFYQGMSEEDMNKPGQSGMSPNRELGQRVTESLIMDKLVKNELEKNKLEVSEEKLQEEIDKMVDQAGGQEEFDSQMEASNLTEDDMKYIVSRGLREQELYSWYKKENKPTDEAINKYFEENKTSLVTYDVSHILVDTEEEAKEIKKSLDEGGDFAALAEEKSIDTASAVKGGDLGDNISMETQFVPEFLDAMAALEEGQISDPVKSQFGYHIIKVNKINDDVESLEDQILDGLLQADFQSYVQGLYSKTEIVKYEPAIVESETKTEETEKSEEDSQSETEADDQTEETEATEATEETEATEATEETEEASE